MSEEVSDEYGDEAPDSEFFEEDVAEAEKVEDEQEADIANDDKILSDDADQKVQKNSVKAQDDTLNDQSQESEQIQNDNQSKKSEENDKKSSDLYDKAQGDTLNDKSQEQAQEAEQIQNDNQSKKSEENAKKSSDLYDKSDHSQQFQEPSDVSSFQEPQQKQRKASSNSQQNISEADPSDQEEQPDELSQVLVIKQSQVLKDKPDKELLESGESESIKAPSEVYGDNFDDEHDSQQNVQQDDSDKQKDSLENINSEGEVSEERELSVPSANEKDQEIQGGEEVQVFFPQKKAKPKHKPFNYRSIATDKYKYKKKPAFSIGKSTREIVPINQAPILLERKRGPGIYTYDKLPKQRPRSAFIKSESHVCNCQQLNVVCKHKKNKVKSMPKNDKVCELCHLLLCICFNKDRRRPKTAQKGKIMHNKTQLQRPQWERTCSPDRIYNIKNIIGTEGNRWGLHAPSAKTSQYIKAKKGEKAPPDMGTYEPSLQGNSQFTTVPRVSMLQKFVDVNEKLELGKSPGPAQYNDKIGMMSVSVRQKWPGYAEASVEEIDYKSKTAKQNEQYLKMKMSQQLHSVKQLAKNAVARLPQHAFATVVLTDDHGAVASKEEVERKRQREQDRLAEQEKLQAQLKKKLNEIPKVPRKKKNELWMVRDGPKFGFGNFVPGQQKIKIL